MNLAIIAAVFPIIFVGELPDKTMFASLVMSTRGKPGSVWLGAVGAFVVHVAIATTIGVALFRLLPHRAVDGIVALMFLAGAALAIREGVRARDEEPLIEHEAASGRRVVTTAFIVIFLAQWGDLTQILTANLAAHYHSPLSVGIGAVLALWAVQHADRRPGRAASGQHPDGALRHCRAARCPRRLCRLASPPVVTGRMFHT